MIGKHHSLIAPWHLLLVLLFVSACVADPEPKILRVSPARLALQELPQLLVVEGQDFNASVHVSLDKDNALLVDKLAVRLGSLDLEDPKLVSSKRVEVWLPKALAVGTHDLELEFGGERLVRAAGAVTIVDEAGNSLSGGDAGEQDSGDGTLASGETGASEPEGSAVGEEAGTTTASSRTDASIMPPRMDEQNTTDAGESVSVTESNLDGGVVPSSTRDAGEFLDGGQHPGDGGASDSGVLFDGGHPDGYFTLPRCGPTEYGQPELITINGVYPGPIWAPALSADHRTLYFAGPGPNGVGETIWRATREDRGPVFSNAERLPNLPGPYGQGTPWVSANDLRLYFYVRTTPGERDLYVASRPSSGAEFANPTPIVELNTAYREHLPWISQDELTILYLSWRENNESDIYVAKRPSLDVPFEAPLRVNSLSATGDVEGRAVMTVDHMRAYFVSGMPGGLGRDDIWVGERTALGDEFSNIQNLSATNTALGESDVAISSDAEELLYVSQETSWNVFRRVVANCP